MSTEQSAPSAIPGATPSTTPSTVPGTPPGNAKSPVPGWLLWFFLGGFGAHRFYFGKVGSGLGMAGLWLGSIVTAGFGIGLLGLLALVGWWIYDAFQINKWARGEEPATTSGFEAPAAGASTFPQVPAAPPSDLPSMSQPTSQSEAA